MKVSALNYKHLHYFWVVAKEGSVTRAAERLGVAVQTISGQVGLLEKALGKTLFAPQGRGLVLTEAGRQVLGYADQIFLLGEQMVEVLQDSNAGGVLRLAVGVSDALPKLVAYRLLDVALRLETLLKKDPMLEVVLTRRTDVFVPLEERTAIANRAQADLFVSIHVNASRNPDARGVETYFLNFASNPDAEAVAARENATSAKTMASLPEIVKAITLNTKLDESRDLAGQVHRAIVRQLTGTHRGFRDLGVKQAPFVVLIGATMPSILAEVSFISNRSEAKLLRTASYRQKVAESILDGLRRYQASLKAVRTVANQ